MIGRNLRMFALLAAVAVMLACVPTLASPAVPPTLDPLSLNTVIAQTAAVAATQTAVFAPPTLTFTPSPAPTKTPTEVLSPTPTFIFVLPTATVPTSTPTPGESGAKFDCRIVAQSPPNNTAFGVNVPFDTTWRISNIGTQNWNGNNTDYHFVSGDRIHLQGVYDLPRSVPVGGQVDIRVSMQAPGTAGTYTTTWRLRMGKNDFCSMTLTIVVQ